MTIEQINELQSAYGYKLMQEQIDSGLSWKLEGSYGRAAMSALKAGACYLPEVSHRDYYGNKVPARGEVKAGTTGSLELACEFWSDPDNYEHIDIDEED
jgi:hypothetical protein